MRIIKPSFEIWKQEEGLEGVYKQIERSGRVCYKSEDKITETSAKEFVERMINSGHTAMLEHGTTYLKVNTEDINKGDCELDLFTDNNPYSRLIIQSDYWYITTNLRVLLEHNLLGLLKYICEPIEYHEKRVTVKFLTDRGVTHEFVRHRVFSFAQESTRYCNYSKKNKFGNELTFIEPCYLNKLCPGDELEKNPETGYSDMFTKIDYLDILTTIEAGYNAAIIAGLQPQEARAVLPNSLKTELVMTGFVSDWRHFFRLRSRIAETGKPHPQAQELADPLMDEFIKRGIMETLL